MKRLIALALCAVLLTGVFAGCASAQPEKSEKTLRVVATIFPIYDWCREILGDTDAIQLELLLDQGVDLHSYQPSASDIVKITSCDLFLFVGGESDNWVKEVLQQAQNPELIALNLLDILGEAVKEESLVEGMQSEAEEEPAADEHVWLSLKNAEWVCRALDETLCALDPKNASSYSANSAFYIDRLAALDERYAAAAASAKQNTLLFADRFPFRYLVDDYGLNYYAAFSGCSAETEASFETVIFLANKVDDLGLSVILQLEDADGTMARTIRDATQSKDQTILALNSMQSVRNAKDQHYLTIMEQNLDVLQKALQ